MDQVHSLQANLEDPGYQTAGLAMLRSYAQDPTGNGRDLPEEVQSVLINKLRANPPTLIFLASPLINIHDLHVVAEVQGRGIGRRLLKAVEEKAQALDCCKLTLEVRENNRPALGLYHRSGFDEGVYEMEAGRVLFRQKPL